MNFATILSLLIIISQTIPEIQINTISEKNNEINFSNNIKQPSIKYINTTKENLEIENKISQITKKEIYLNNNIIDKKLAHKILNNYIITNNPKNYQIIIKKTNKLNFCPIGYEIEQKPNQTIIFVENNISAIIALSNLELNLNYNKNQICNYKTLIEFDTIKTNKESKPKHIIFNNSYELLHYKPKISEKLKQILNLTTVITASGLWSNLDTSLNIPNNITNLGFEVFKIQLTGGKKQNTNYNFTDLTNTVLPNYINFIKNITKNNITYIGHSNACKTALYSLENKKIKINNLIGMGCPGEFKGFNPVVEIIKIKEHEMFENFTKTNITHITFEQAKTNILKIPLSSKDNSTISTNLFKDYINTMKTKKENIGKNIVLNNSLLIYSNILLNNDFIVFSKDTKEIHNNINSTNKEIKKLNYNHLELPEKQKTINILLPPAGINLIISSKFTLPIFF